MNVKAFLVDALTSALDLGMATNDDVIKHVTPEILAAHLPRPLWARLLTACLGAPRVDATLVVETIGVPNLCEHVPSSIMWGVLAEVGARSIGLAAGSTAHVAKPPTKPLAIPAAPTAIPPSKSEPTRVPIMMAPPPEAIAPLPVTATQPSPTVPVPEIPAPALDELFSDMPVEDRPTGPANPSRARTPTQQRFRQSGTGIGRLAANARRPQANASASPPDNGVTNARRASTESEYEVVTDVAGKSTDDWKATLAVEDEQLVDWASSEETMAGSPSDDRRKR